MTDKNDGPPAEMVREEVERPRGILTEKDRALLMGEAEDLSERAREQRWVRLRRRVRNGILDGLQLMLMPPEQRRLVFNPRSDEEILGGAIFWLRFLYIGLKESESGLDETLEGAFREAELKLAQEEETYLTDLRVNVSVSTGDRIDVEAAREKLQDSERRADLKPSEIDALLSEVRLRDEEWEMLREVNRTKFNRHRSELPEVELTGITTLYSDDEE